MVDEYYKLDIIELDFALLMLLGPILYQFYERCKRMGFFKYTCMYWNRRYISFPVHLRDISKNKKMYKDVQRCTKSQNKLWNKSIRPDGKAGKIVIRLWYLQKKNVFKNPKIKFQTYFSKSKINMYKVFWFLQLMLNMRAEHFQAIGGRNHTVPICFMYSYT